MTVRGVEATAAAVPIDFAHALKEAGLAGLIATCIHCMLPSRSSTAFT